MVQYVFYSIWLAIIVMLGIAEAAVALPIFAVGFLIQYTRQLSWWLRLCIIFFVGTIWAVSQLLSPAVFVLLLLGGVWLDSKASQIFNKRTSIFWISVLIAMMNGVLRNVNLTILLGVLFCLQVWLFWVCTKLLTSRQLNGGQFFIPPKQLRRGQSE